LDGEEIRSEAGECRLEAGATCELTGVVVAAVVEAILGDFAAQGVAVHAKVFGSAGLVAVVALKNAFNEPFFEFADCLVE
jgi:hypothetical protein